ncbi:MAG: pyruvate dehydrogenase complex dihydrolipoamide acetyltransferase [Gluconacetobacter liquefaciens]
MAVNICMPGGSSAPGLATLARWLKTEGDPVSVGDVLAEIEADKATMEIEAPADGILARILVPDGTPDVEAEQIIGIVGGPGEAISDIPPAGVVQPPPAEAQASISAPAPAPSVTHPEPPPAIAHAGADRRIVASPVARRLAHLRGVDLRQITGSGPAGRILRRDVEGATPQAVSNAAPQATPTPPLTSMPPQDDGNIRSLPVSAMRRTIAQRLTAAKQTVPHFYVSIDVEMDALLALRQTVNEIAAADGSAEACHLSINDMLIRAVALALKALPAVNVCWAEDSILFHHRIDVAVAVSVPDGLLTPLIRDAGAKSLTTIARESQALIARAREGRLRTEDMQGGCFTLSNAGMFGVDTMTAIINPPHAAILAVGAIGRRPVIRQEQVAIASVMTCTLSADHRVVDGALAAQWLDAFRTIVEQPLRLML